jgi:hypothetical protein
MDARVFKGGTLGQSQCCGKQAYRKKSLPHNRLVGRTALLRSDAVLHTMQRAVPPL